MDSYINPLGPGCHISVEVAAWPERRVRHIFVAARSAFISWCQGTMMTGIGKLINRNGTTHIGLANEGHLALPRVLLALVLDRQLGLIRLARFARTRRHATHTFCGSRPEWVNDLQAIFIGAIISYMFAFIHCSTKHCVAFSLTVQPTFMV